MARFVMGIAATAALWAGATGTAQAGLLKSTLQTVMPAVLGPLPCWYDEGQEICATQNIPALGFSSQCLDARTATGCYLTLGATRASCVESRAASASYGRCTVVLGPDAKINCVDGNDGSGPVQACDTPLGRIPLP